jgi:hypothetical protein
MTVGELKEYLEEFDDDQEVCIGLYQKYGCDFTFDIDSVVVNDMRHFYGRHKEDIVMIMEGCQTGTIEGKDD